MSIFKICHHPLVSYDLRIERTIGIISLLIVIARSLWSISELRIQLTQTQRDLLMAQQQIHNNTILPTDTSLSSQEDTFADNTGGIFTPISEIILKDDLLKHPELIPYSGVLGGTMNFYSEDTRIKGHERGR